MSCQKVIKKLGKYSENVTVLRPLLYSKIIYSKLISHDHNNLLKGYFEIDKILELIARKYYGLIFHCIVKIYVNICL